MVLVLQNISIMDKEGKKVNYKNDLFNPDISWSEMSTRYNVPEKLYKYQAFYTDEGQINEHWKGNMRGEFHLSLGEEFDDTDDCRPYINKIEVINFFERFLKCINCDEKKKMEAIAQLDSVITEDEFVKVQNNFRQQIRIGCFTCRKDNLEMWNKYSNQGKGYCIEYDTKKSILFSYSTLPVLYLENTYDSSFSYACTLFLELVKDSKSRNDEENLHIYQKYYERIYKMTYIPLFIKKRSIWSFEEEYRLFLLKRRSAECGTIYMSEYLDDKYNLNLSNCINGIYLGENFYENENVDQILLELKDMSRETHVPIFWKDKSIIQG